MQRIVVQAFNIVGQTSRRTLSAALTLAIGGALALPPSEATAQQMVPGGWYTVGVVTRIHAGDGSGYFYFSSATALGVAACGQNGYGYAFADASSNTNRNFALLTMAYTTAKPISIHLTGGCSTGVLGRPLVDTIEITDVAYF